MNTRYPVAILVRANAASREQTCDYSIGDVFFTCGSKRIVEIICVHERALTSIRGFCEEHMFSIWDGFSTAWTRINLYHAGQPMIQNTGEVRNGRP